MGHSEALMNKVVIGVPCGSGTVKSSMITSLLSAIMSAGCPTALMVRDGCWVHQSRALFVQAARESGCSHVFMVDSDQAFPADIIPRLLSSRKDIVGAAYNRRQLPLLSTVNALETGQPVIDMPDALFRCHSMGAGCILIKTDVFARIPAPWFDFVYNLDGSLAQGEDGYFCVKARAAGIDVWCDPTIPVKHIGDYEY